MDSTMGMAGELIQGWSQMGDLPNMVFFHEINSFLNDEIAEFADNLLGRMAAILGGAVLSLLTLWIIIQGYRIVTGQSRESMMVLVTNSLRAVLIVGIAIGAAAGAGSIYNTLTDGLSDVVNEVVTGSEDGGTYKDIDKTLAIMQVALGVIDSVDEGDDLITEDRKNRALWFTGVGLGGPAVMAGAMLLLNKIAMALIVGLGPLFILCLLFDQTKQLFNKWLFFGIGTLFSLAVLTVMVTLALDMVIAVGLAFWVTNWITGGQESLTAMAMQQGGLGIILTMLIITVPPMAAIFFNGTMGQLAAFNAMSALSPSGNNASPPGSGIPPGGHSQITSPTYAAQTDNSPRDSGRRESSYNAVAGGTYTGSRANQSDAIKKSSDLPRGNDI